MTEAHYEEETILLPKVGIPNFVSGPREYIMDGEYVILAMCSWFRIRYIENAVHFSDGGK